jgi:phage terminase large subunit
MTTSRSTEVDRRSRGRPTGGTITFGRKLAIRLRADLKVRAGERILWPNAKYRDDPVGFAHDVLGVEPWAKQVEILEAVRDHPRVAVRSGHKTGKSNSAGIIAWWFYCSWPDARVVMSSTTSRQVDIILWRELTMMHARGGRCIACKRELRELMGSGIHQIDAEERIPKPCAHSALIDGEVKRLARTGVRSEDFRTISGFTAKEAEAIAGISGRNLLFIIDEASGVPDEIFEAIEGNRAGGARIVLFSNPTRTTGEFFEAFHKKSALYRGLRVSSAETPNAVTGTTVIPGLAEAAWIAEKGQEWGENSPQYKVRVEGEFPVGEDGRIFTLQAILAAEQLWPEVEAVGRLFVGFDPAGEAGTGDEMALCARRGRKAIRFDIHRGLGEYDALLELLLLLVELRDDGEKPVVVVDVEGEVGAKVHTALRDYEEGALRDSKLREFLNANKAHPLLALVGGSKQVPFDLVTVRASERAKAKAKVYHRLRDRLCGNLADWLRGEPGQDNGGAIPEDAKLSAELHCLVWIKVDNGPLQLMPKTEIRKILGRSPDRYDALALSVWEPRWLQDDDEEAFEASPALIQSLVAPVSRRNDDGDDDEGGAMDPYARPIDPYGGR